MAELPVKQSTFSKIRQGILNTALRGRFSRRMIANFAPNFFGSSLVSYVSAHDDENLTKTTELISSMGKGAIKSNMTSMMNSIKNTYPDNSINEGLHKIYASLDQKSQDAFSTELVNYILNDYNSFYYSDDTLNMIFSSVDFQSKNKTELDNIIKKLEDGFSHSRESYYLFTNLTLEQKEENFSRFVRNNLDPRYLQQIPEEDRFEQYNHILEIYKNKDNIYEDYNISSCFGMLSENERINVLDDTFSIIRRSDSASKGTSYLNILKNIPAAQQEQYYKEIYEYLVKNNFAFVSYVSFLDKSLHKYIAHDVIESTRVLNNSSMYDQFDTIKQLNSADRNQAFVDILSNSTDNQQINYILNLLHSYNDLLTDFQNFTVDNNIQQVMTSEKLQLLNQNGSYIEDLVNICNTVDCNRLVNNYIQNPQEQNYPTVVENISRLYNEFNLWNLNTNTSDQIYNKKLESIMTLFSSLDSTDKNKYFQTTVNSILNNIGNRTEVSQFFDLLDEQGKITNFTEFVNTIYEKYDINQFISIIDSALDTIPPNAREEIYSQYESMLNNGSISDFKRALPALISEKFAKDLQNNKPNSSFLTEERLAYMLDNPQMFDDIPNFGSTAIYKLADTFIATRLDNIKNNFYAMNENEKEENIGNTLMALSKQFDLLSKNRYIVNNFQGPQLYAISDIYFSLDKEQKNRHYNDLCNAIDSLDPFFRNEGYNQVFQLFDEEEKLQRFPNFYERLNPDISNLLKIYNSLDNTNKVKIFEDFIIQSPERLQLAAEILSSNSISNLNTIFQGKTTLDQETITTLINLKEDIALKALLFDEDIDRKKIIDLSSYNQLQKGSISVDSVIQKLYMQNLGKSKQEFNQVLDSAYNLFTYNNVPEFMKNFRLFQLGSYYEQQNSRITSFQDKSLEERDTLILEDLFKISLDSNNESLRDFCNIISEGKRITTVLQTNPEENIKKLSSDELAILSQYRDTLFDLHNLTKEIKNTDRPTIQKSGDIVQDLRTLVHAYSYNQSTNNVVFNPNVIMDELFDGFITTSIRPNAMLQYMDMKKEASDARHLNIEQQLRDGTMHLEEGDFIKGIGNFDEYIPSMLRDGVKGGEFNQEYSHSDMTPLDADFGYISKENVSVPNQTDSQIISKTISASYGDNFLVLKNYAERLQDRSTESFDQGTFTGSPDYYNIDTPGSLTNSRYVRTGIPTLDIDYIVSKKWNPFNGYEMAMAGVYIPVIDSSGKVVFSSDDYKKIRDQMRGLSHYNAEDLEVSEKAQNMDALFAAYKKIGQEAGKNREQVDSEIEAVKGLIDGKPDEITAQKKAATTKFIQDFFLSKGIIVTDNLSQNLSSKSIELIDTGSTGRGTNVPGDGDFDFMLRHNISPEIITELSRKVETSTTGKFDDLGAEGFRAKDVILPTSEKVDIDVTVAKKDLSLTYSSDMCISDRLNNIKEKDPEKYKIVQANIIMAKKMLKAKGIYKKLRSDGATEHGGFGGIGVENWVLQNGGSFEQAISTFLDAAHEVNSESADKSTAYARFKQKYPIYDFGFNHRESTSVRHDNFSAFFNNDPDMGFNYVVQSLSEIQKEIEFEKQKQETRDLESPLLKSISTEGFAEAGSRRSALRTKFSFSKMRNMVSKFMSTQNINRNESSLEEK